MKVVIREQVKLDGDNELVYNTSEDIKKKLSQLNKTINLINPELLFSKCDEKICEGDIFAIQPQKEKFIFGKVLSTSVKLFDSNNKIQPTCVVFIYKTSSDLLTMPTNPLDFNNLLIEPSLQTDYFFHSGYAKILGNTPLTEEEKNLDLGFFWGYKNTNIEFEVVVFTANNPTGEHKIEFEQEKCYFDVNNQVLDHMPKYCGYLEVKGLALVFDIARELIKDSSIIGIEYQLPQKKILPPKINQPKNIEIPEIKNIVSNMVSFHRDSGDYKGDMKRSIESFSGISYAFYNESLKTSSEAGFLSVVQKYVLDLNNLNEFADHQLIETDEREQIYSFIEHVSEKLGYIFSFDITEKYREW